MRIGSVARKRETLDFSHKFLGSTINLIYAFLLKWSFIILKGIYHEKLYFNMLSVSKHLVKKDMSFFMKVNGCQEKEQKN